MGKIRTCVMTTQGYGLRTNEPHEFASFADFADADGNVVVSMRSHTRDTINKWLGSDGLFLVKAEQHTSMINWNEFFTGVRVTLPSQDPSAGPPSFLSFFVGKYSP